MGSGLRWTGLVLLAGVLGYVLATLQSAPAAGASDAPSAAMDPSLDARLGALTDRLDRLIDVLSAPAAQRPSSGDTQRQAAEESTSPVESVVARLDALIARLDTIGSGARPQPLQEIAKNDAAVAESAAVLQQDSRILTRRVFGWSPRDVLARYGIPDHTLRRPDGADEWGYFANKEWCLHFHVHDGLVYQAGKGYGCPPH